MDSAPVFALATTDVHCPWEHKGRVMRVLAQEEGGPNVDYTDGIKITKGGNWALVLPDASDPCFHVFAEGTDQTAAAELAQEFSERVRKLAA